MKAILFFQLFAAILVSVFAQGDPCQRRYYDFDSFVCVCDANSCDFPGPVVFPTGNNYTRVVTSRDEHRFAHFEGTQETAATGTTTILVEHFLGELQDIYGFGGAFTDSASINIMSLSTSMQDLLMRSYFGNDGNDYNLCRTPIAGCDFSLYAYSYDDEWLDEDLSEFNLTIWDFDYKIPLMHRAFELSSQEVLIFGSPWSPPAWMKTNEMFNGTGSLKPEYWDLYSQYLILFIKAYEANGVPIWGFTPQNEPTAGFENWAWNACGWTAEDMRDWIKTYFGPNLTTAGYGDKMLMGNDYNRGSVPDYPGVALDDPDAAQYIDGTAVHWYEDWKYGPERLDWLYNNYTDKFILYTEACAGIVGDSSDRINLGSWQRADIYAHDIIEDLNHHASGWVDWNLALDTTGGPNWANNLVESPIFVNDTADEFLKQPSYYAMGHFSRYIRRGAKVIPTAVLGNTTVFEAVAVHNPNGEEVVVVLNRGSNTEAISIETHRGEFINFDMAPMSVETIIYQ